MCIFLLWDLGADMRNQFGQRGTLRREIKEPECHWGWQAAGTVIGLVCLSWLGVYIAERLVG